MIRPDEMSLNAQTECVQEELYWKIFEKSGSLDAYIGYSKTKKGDTD